MNLSQYQGQEKPVAGRFARPVENQQGVWEGPINEGGADRDWADTGIEAQTEAGHGSPGGISVPIGGVPGLRESCVRPWATKSSSGILAKNHLPFCQVSIVTLRFSIFLSSPSRHLCFIVDEDEGKSQIASAGIPVLLDYQGQITGNYPPSPEQENR